MHEAHTKQKNKPKRLDDDHSAGLANLFDESSIVSLVQHHLLLVLFIHICLRGNVISVGIIIGCIDVLSEMVSVPAPNSLPLSSILLLQLVGEFWLLALSPPPPLPTLDAACSLGYRASPL